MESYQTWAALASRIRGVGAGASGESELERLTDRHVCRGTNSQTAGNMKMLCYIFRYSFISLPLQKWYTLLEQALAT